MIGRKQFFPVRYAANSFRQSLPATALHVAAEPEKKKKPQNEDVRLFLLSFTAFFVAISAFIW